MKLEEVMKVVAKLKIVVIGHIQNIAVNCISQLKHCCIMNSN